MPKAIEIATKIIKSDEESNIFKTKPYYCSEHYPTIGWGFRIPGTNQHDPLPDMTMTSEEGDKKFDAFVFGLYHGLCTHQDTATTFKRLSDLRQAVILSMCYQLGMGSLLGFHDMWKALFLGDFNEAAKEALDSKAAREDTPERWARNAEMIRTDMLHAQYGGV